MEYLGLIQFYDFEVGALNYDIEFLDLSHNFFYHGLSWVYSFSINLHIFNTILWYTNSYLNFLDDNFNYFFFFFWQKSFFIQSKQLFFAVFLDMFLKLFLFKINYSENWFSFFFVLYPELLFLKSYTLEYYNEFFTNQRFSFYSINSKESYFININLLVQLILLLLIISIFIVIYFSFYTSAVKEESFIDSDYLNNSSLVEAEKEISSLDDIILIITVLVYIFGWYFFIHCYSILSFSVELSLVFYLLPIMYFIIIGIPTFLMLDFGIFFLVYLRGISKSSFLSVELIYDYLAVLIFYTRIIVQGIRLVLMLFTYLSMQELVMFLTFNQSILLGYDFFLENFNYISLSLDSFSYFLLFSFTGYFIYWVYEIMHTYFVVSIQILAFFSIVFWLFLFLYTFFVIEKQENYFSEKRKKKKFFFSYLQ